MSSISQRISTNQLLYFIAFALGFVFIGIEYNRDGDFYFYYSAATKILTDSNLYDQLHGKNQVFEYYGSPVLTLALIPLTLLPISIAALFIKLCSILSIVRVWKIFEFYFPSISSQNEKKLAWMAIGFGSMAFMLYSNFHHVQFTILLLYLCVEGYHQLVHGKMWLGAVLLVFGIFLKISPIVILPYLAYRGHFRQVGAVVICLLLMSALPMLVAGFDHGLALWSGWFNQLNPSSELNVFDMNNEKNQGISAWLSTLFIADIRHIESTVYLRRHIMDLPKSTVVGLIWTGRAILILATLYILNSRPFSKAKSLVYEFRELSYLLAVIPLIFPQQRSYNFLMLMPAIAYIGYVLIVRSSFRKIDWTFFVIILLLLNIELLLGEFRRFYWHYKILTYAGLITIGLLSKISIKGRNIASEH